MPRYTKKDKDGRYYIESVNGRLESDKFGHTYGEAIDRFAEFENADVVPRADYESLKIELGAMRGAANSYKMHYEGFLRRLIVCLKSILRNVLKKPKLTLKTHFGKQSAVS